MGPLKIIRTILLPDVFAYRLSQTALAFAWMAYRLFVQTCSSRIFQIMKFVPIEVK